ncbi:hypothetical protein [Caudovirales GX15bay]|nr:hypothetical protein [Caudovirales GX15bay]
MAEPYGEFLDYEWYYTPCPVPAVVEPWRSHRFAGRCFLVPRELLFRVAQQERLTLIAQDTERLVRVRASLQTDGLRFPLELVIDDGGHIVLRDGHHRLLSSEGLPLFRRLPVYFTRSPGIGVPALRTADLLELLIRLIEPVAV